MEHLKPTISASTPSQQGKSVLVLCALLSALVLYLDLLLPLGVAVGVLYVTAVLASIWSPWKYLTWIVALAVSVLIILGYLFSPAGGELWKVLLNRFISLLAVWATAFISMQRKQEEMEKMAALHREKQILEETKVIRGLLPICATCKKIRDDRGYWNQIEAYIESRSEAQFTHGICLECQEKLYGTQEWYIKGKRSRELPTD